MKISIDENNKELRLKYKFIHFDLLRNMIDDKPDYYCRNNKTKDILGKIFFYDVWNQYCFEQYAPGMVFNDKCLLDIVDFMQKLNRKHRS